jgi:hypothetical protein
MNAHRRRVIGDSYRRYQPATLDGGKFGVRNTETGQLIAGALYETEVLARTKALDLAAEDVDAYFEGARA